MLLCSFANAEIRPTSEVADGALKWTAGLVKASDVLGMI